MWCCVRTTSNLTVSDRVGRFYKKRKNDATIAGILHFIFAFYAFIRNDIRVRMDYDWVGWGLRNQWKFPLHTQWKLALALGILYTCSYTSFSISDRCLKMGACVGFLPALESDREFFPYFLERHQVSEFGYDPLGIRWFFSDPAFIALSCIIARWARITGKSDFGLTCKVRTTCRQKKVMMKGSSDFDD